MAEGASGAEDLEWLSDCIIGLLKSPTWVAPIESFIDERCIIFDAEEENKFEYTTCHNEFKQLVDDLFTAHLLDLSVTYEQFQHFCLNGLGENARMHRLLVQRLASVEDFLTFKAMMVKRNESLFREALAQIEHNGGLVSEDPPLGCHAAAAREDALAAAAAGCVAEAGRRALDAAAAGDGQEGAGDDDWNMYDEDNLYLAAQYEREQLEEALKASAELDQEDAQRKAEEAELAQAIALSIQAEEERQRVCDTAAAVAAAEASGAPPPAGPAPARTLPPLRAVPGAPLRNVAPRMVAVAPLSGAPAAEQSAPEPAPSPAPPRISPADALAAARAAVARANAGGAADQGSEAAIVQRAEHLKRQRDILVQKKVQERERQKGAFLAAKQRSAADGAAAAATAAAPSGQSLAAELSGAAPAAAAAGQPLPEEAKAEAANRMMQALAAQAKETYSRSGEGA